MSELDVESSSLIGFRIELEYHDMVRGRCILYQVNTLSNFLAI